MENQRKRTMTPPLVLLISFLVLITVGTFLLSLPISVKEGVDNSVLTALFTTTSAVAVTGLSVVDVSKFYSYFGTTVIMVLIQLGGLGVMTFSSIIMLVIGKRISYEERKVLQEGLNRDSLGGIVKYVKKVVYIALGIELIGAILLFSRLVMKYPLKKALYYSIFHSISAFCNAGFALWSDSLVWCNKDYFILIILAVLIILGGIGFSVINMYLAFYLKKEKKLTLSARMAVKISLWLILIGSLFFFVFEFQNTLKGMPLLGKIFNSFFQSITTRTAGFNSLPIGMLKQETLLIFIILMFIGASPGSTGGGIKTTTFGVIMFYAFSIIRQESEVTIRNRRIPIEIVHKALTLLVIAILYITGITLLILILEDFNFLSILFEVVSAFATVGLSTGITADLSSLSKILIIFTMYLGRVGPLTIAIVLGGKSKKSSKIKYPEENISIG